MPQLDQYSFFTQYFWLFVCFLGFYFLILKIFLPQIAQILKVRASMMEGSGNELEKIVLWQYTEKICASGYEVNGLKSSKDLFTKSFEDTSSWSSMRVAVANESSFNFGPIHKAYIETIGQFSLSQNLSLKQLESLLPPTASVNKALSSYPQREVAFDIALFQNLKLCNL
jgi:hypothetical protein